MKKQTVILIFAAICFAICAAITVGMLWHIGITQY